MVEQGREQELMDRDYWERHIWKRGIKEDPGAVITQEMASRIMEMEAEFLETVWPEHPEQSFFVEFTKDGIICQSGKIQWGAV